VKQKGAVAMRVENRIKKSFPTEGTKEEYPNV
jgi:hypothetical protein